MAKIVGSAPVLLVHDVVAAATYWRDKLGFAWTRFYGEPPAFCMPARDGHIVMLSQAPKDHALVPHWQIVDQMWNAYFWVNDAEALYAELRERGATIDYHLGIKPYGVKEFGVQDLDGHDIGFGENLD